MDRAATRRRKQIEDQAQRLPWTQGRERIEQIHWFATVGEPAYPKLLELVQDERPDVAGSAMAALGATRVMGPVIRGHLWTADPAEPTPLPVIAGGFAAVEAEFMYRLGRDAPADKVAWTNDEALAYVDELLVGVEGIENQNVRVRRRLPHKKAGVRGRAVREQGLDQLQARGRGLGVVFRGQLFVVEVVRLIGERVVG